MSADARPIILQLAIPLMRTRREFLNPCSLAGLGCLTPVGRSLAQSPAADPWAEAATIVRRIVPPTFPDRTFDITRYGATRDGGDATQAFRAAIDACHTAGGGRVVVPAGRY